MNFYKYLQLPHVLQAHLGSQNPKISKFPPIVVLRSLGPKGLICLHYSHLVQAKVRDKWQAIIPNMTDERWEEICSMHLTVLPADNNRFIQGFFFSGNAGERSTEVLNLYNDKECWGQLDGLFMLAAGQSIVTGGICWWGDLFCCGSIVDGRDLMLREVSIVAGYWDLL